MVEPVTELVEVQDLSCVAHHLPQTLKHYDSYRSQGETVDDDKNLYTDLINIGLIKFIIQREYLFNRNMYFHDLKLHLNEKNA
jgi:hypothetical protein